MKLEKIINIAFAFGAAIVIYGALQKITHRPSADLFLSIGLYSEVVLFVVMGIQEFIKKPEPSTTIQTNGVPADNSELTESINQLNSTIKKVFNR